MPQLPPSLARSISASPMRRTPVVIAFVTVLAVLLAAGLIGYGLWLGQHPSRAPGVFLLALLAAVADFFGGWIATSGKHRWSFSVSSCSALLSALDWRFSSRVRRATACFKDSA